MKGPALPPDYQVDHLTISLRAFADRGRLRKPSRFDAAKRNSGPSGWTLILDTETTTDPGQALRFGTYQVRKGSVLHDLGIFYEPRILLSRDLKTIKAYAKAHDLKLITRDEFVDEVFYPIGYDLRATIVGFNLPFDLSRIAIGSASARGDMRGGFSCRLTNDKRRPAIQIRHLSQKASLIRFAAPFRSRDLRSARKRGSARVPRGFFVDCRTFAAAQFAKSFTLKSLSEFLKVEHPKLSADEYGGPITAKFIEYAVRDVQTTWECYEELARRYKALDLKDTPPPLIYSEASIGKAYLKAMGVKPWREVQSNVPAPLLARIMGSYYGGRSEVRIRRELRQVVLCDFLSMYPTACTLMGLWRYVIANGMTWRDDTERVRRFLGAVTLDDLQKPETWKRLNVLVRIQPEWDIFPVRAPYGEEAQATIGANYLKADQPLWFSLADCIASKLLTGVSPKIVEALVFEPSKPQSNLRPVAIGGNQDYLVDPVRDDFYERLIELRNEVKIKRDRAKGPDRSALDTEQNAIKIAANATSYGVFVEVNVKERIERGKVTIHSSADRPYVVETAKDETLGRFFHPLLATLITGAARLMLAIAERLVADLGLEWAFCDTDSIAIAKPKSMDEADFHARVDKIVTWFAALNPYEFGGSILKVEDVNFGLKNPKARKPLFCWAVSAKRYALFNLDTTGRPILRKASAHGLGHLRAPYDDTNPAKDIPPPAVAPDKIGVELWQHDLWWKIIVAALADKPDQVDLTYHPALNRPAVSRYAATTPKLLKWFSGFNESRPYERQVKPFGFLYSLFAGASSAEDFSEIVLPAGLQTPRRRLTGNCKPVAPYESKIARAVEQAFDRETSEPVPVSALKSFKQVIAQYHLHPESKFLNGDYLDRGITRRRHVHAASIRNIGKEANEWEEQFYLGFDEDEQIDYGFAPKGSKEFLRQLSAEVRAVGGQRWLAIESGVSRRTVSRLMKGRKVRGAVVAKILRVLKAR